MVFIILIFVEFVDWKFGVLFGNILLCICLYIYKFLNECM